MHDARPRRVGDALLIVLYGTGCFEHLRAVSSGHAPLLCTLTLSDGVRWETPLSVRLGLRLRMPDGDDAACGSGLATSAPGLVTKAVCSNLDWHDRWNLLAIGGLNVAHCAWWCSLLPEHLLSALFFADVGYICGDLAWIALVPGCVPAGARPTLLLHHALTCCCAPVAIGRPVLMAHLLRAWVVELHSWNHIAARQLVRTPRLRKVLQARLATPCHRRAATAAVCR